MTQFVTRVDDDLASAVDELVTAGVVASRSEAVRRGLEELIELHRRAIVGQQIVGAYRHAPQTDHEVGWADEATARMIGDDPW
jgi:Arc/MetJ-type ribon-helix-helix transcriptional regulator